MAVTLGSYTFDLAHTAVREAHQEVGGRRERVVEINGVIVGESSPAAIEAKLDAILSASASDTYTAALSLREGRRLLVRRTEFERHVSPDALTGAFVLKLHARDPIEESITTATVNWTVQVSGSTLPLTTEGTAPAPLSISLFAIGDVVNPAFDDGERTITYSGTVPDGSTLVFDGVTQRVTLDGEDVTPYTQGLFPCVDPVSSTLRYTDAAASSHHANVTVAYRERWW
ncbi:MAG: phage tail family protein [Candidatus Hydrogenedentes bacterium]|nr:phage tail family protein [Candidatus Hydrogenedentota bacterium]